MFRSLHNLSLSHGSGVAHQIERAADASSEEPQEPEYLKVEEVAASLKVQERTVRDWILRTSSSVATSAIAHSSGYASLY
jgi:hypothetical protein